MTCQMAFRYWQKRTRGVRLAYDKCAKNTYIRSDVFVLEVISVFPDIDADDGSVRCHQRILVRRRDNLELLGLLVQALVMQPR